MPVPPPYQRAGDHFYAFLFAAKAQAGLDSTHQTYTMVQGVFQAFRRRLPLQDAIRFANELPPLLRSLFTADWDPDEPVRAFTDRATMTREVQALRHDHNFAPDTAIQDVATALRACLEEAPFDRLLETLPEGAIDFWRAR